MMMNNTTIEYKNYDFNGDGQITVAEMVLSAFLFISVIIITILLKKLLRCFNTTTQENNVENVVLSHSAQRC